MVYTSKQLNDYVFLEHTLFDLNIFYSSQDMIKDQAEQEAMFSPLYTCIVSMLFHHSYRLDQNDIDTPAMSSHNTGILA